MKRNRRIAAFSLIVLIAFSSEPLHVGARQESSRPQPAAGQSVTMLSDGRWLLLGGAEHPSRAAVYDSRSRTTREVRTLQTPRAWHAATVLPDGTVLVTGGLGADNQRIASAEHFRLEGDALAALGEFDVPARAAHTATLLTDGRVLLAGGDTNGGPPAEILDPLTNSVLAVPGPPRYARRNGHARLLGDGRVLVSGGVDSSGQPLSETELFDPEVSSFVHAGTLSEPGDALRVTAVSPVDGATTTRDVRLTVRFSHPVDPADAAAIEILGPDSRLRPARLVFAEEGMLAFVSPRGPLSEGVYLLRIGRVRSDATSMNAPFVSRFIVSGDEPASSPDTFDWRGDAARAFNSPWRKLPALAARPGVTALAGQVLLLDGEPLRNVALVIGSQRTRTDRTGRGRFLIELGNASSGWRQMLIDGTSANRAGAEYGIFDVAVQVMRGRTVALPYTIWMPQLDTANAVRLDSPTQADIVTTTPHIPGLELHLPKGTVVKDRDGKIVRQISMTPIPVDRPPFPLPGGVEVPVYFTLQPGGAYLSHTYRSGRTGPWLVYPNYKNDAPGTRAHFWHYDPKEKGWYVYGMGRVAQDGRQVVPDLNVALYTFTGAMINTGQTPPPNGPAPGTPDDGDPVDLGTGLFVMEKTDLAIQDVLPLALTRTYRPGDNANRPFGIGTTHPYAMFLWSADQYEEADLVLPDGGRIHYVRISPGTAGRMRCSSTPRRRTRSTNRSSPGTATAGTCGCGTERSTCLATKRPCRPFATASATRCS